MKASLSMVCMLVLAAAAQAQEPAPGFKNVRHLQDLTRLEMQRTMNFMRASLGVHCDFCHVVTEKDGWQWEKDDKPAKVTARRMIAMVEQLNRETFAGRPVVSCHTCHRGRQHPVSLPPLPQPAPPFPTVAESVTPPSAPPTVEALWKRFQDAVRFTAPPSSRVLQGQRVTERETRPWEIHEKGGRAHVAFTTSKGRVEQVLDGSEGWMRDGESVRALDPDDRARVRESVDALAFPPPAPPPGARVTAREEVDGRPCWVVEWTAGGGTVRLYLEETTGLLLRKETLTPRLVGVVPERIDYRDYRDVGQGKMPSAYVTAYVDPWTGGTRTFTRMEVDVPVADALFAQPALASPRP